MIAASDIVACRKLLRGGSRTFYAASLVLPRSVSDPAIALYAFCRLADDAVDVDGGRFDAVNRLSERLDRAYAGQPFPLPADRAFEEMVARFAIPRALPEALLQGLAWDVEGRRYETLEDLLDYAARVAGAVGAMMSLLMRRREPAVVARACELGIAMQLTNIARDVGEDARAGRLYLPQQWLREAGIDPEAFLVDPHFDVRVGEIIGRLLTVAEGFYRRSIAGIGALPVSCRPGIHAARLIYAEIGRELERGGLDSISRRAVVSGSRKLRLIADALLQSLGGHDLVSDHIEPAVRYLVDAVAASQPAVILPQSRRKGAVEQAVWMLDLFERLERRDQLLRAGDA
ncbi:phytoene/squalene synthase family protein [Bradyrhizobium guangzhouense]|uniref:Phytoene/squalene synthase family protein n=1 Tax=Bradyrhizobium guangzhouense TaxID=1325095 RepID=A0AAE5WWG2_9BRAD|nr:phytoene/squalene synthase family protein [Bradyrhizobium guangzhouense]QAU44356.1 phytoene/squalene synthase family protein [Bradyrhizobium guangzhouense]RXH09339.1 phytoene/squalene synthase family protein [Bradyrhizobium guangzhouense]RXH10073.1 phytoene/squalene synthase family protein [Bradyrhizobium guangzhouense]